MPLRPLLACLSVLLLAAGAESASVSDILSNQTQLNAHLTELQKSVETELADIHLDSSEIAQRHDQIAEDEAAGYVCQSLGSSRGCCL